MHLENKEKRSKTEYT